MDGLLLHACCGPCSTVSVPAWRSTGLEPTLLFVNPNIHPATEFARRLQSLERFAEVAGVGLVADASLGPADWLAALGEGDRDVVAAADDDEARFSTTLTVSPYQRHDLIERAGDEAAAEWGVEFLYRDLRPHFRRSYDESRRLGLYRQRYCGCAVSKWRAWESRHARRDGETRAS
jgi:predicted adenine nucleotide alpha hydrolase (AANH) superfamily ATPase